MYGQKKWFKFYLKWFFFLGCFRKIWGVEFNRDHTLFQDDEQSLGPKTTAIDEIVTKITKYRWMTLRELFCIAGISMDRVYNILNAALLILKLFCAVVVAFVTSEVYVDFLRRFITVGEIRIHLILIQTNLLTNPE